MLAFGQWQEEDEPLRPGNNKRSFVSRAAKLIERSGSEAAEKNEQGEPPRLQHVDPERPESGDEDPGLQAVEEREDNQRLLEVVRVRAGLAKREKQVLDLMCKRCTDAEIAKRLGMKQETVRGHRKRAVDKMKDVVKEISNNSER